VVHEATYLRTESNRLLYKYIYVFDLQSTTVLDLAVYALLIVHVRGSTRARINGPTSLIALQAVNGKSRPGLWDGARARLTCPGACLESRPGLQLRPGPGCAQAGSWAGEMTQRRVNYILICATRWEIHESIPTYSLSSVLVLTTNSFSMIN
jgi:hypothetical protein